MLFRFEFLLAALLLGAGAAAMLARRLETVDAARLARGFLVGVAALMAVRAIAYVAANVFGVQTVRPISTGPFDPTNVLIGALYGIGALQLARHRFDTFLREPELLLALRLATGVAFILAGLVNAFIAARGGPDYFVRMGYTATFHHFIMTAEVLGGAALLLPWRWLTLTAAAGLTIDMFGALYTQMRAGDPLDAAAFAMIFRLVPLAIVTLNGRWRAVGVGAILSAGIAIAGAESFRA